jgi:hypothetical protein
MHRAALECAVGRYFVERFQVCVKAAVVDMRYLLCRESAAQLILISRYLHDVPLSVCSMDVRVLGDVRVSQYRSA